MKKLRTALQSRYLFKVFAIIILGVGIVYTNIHHGVSKYKNNNTCFDGVISKYSLDGNKLDFYLNAKETLVVTYYIKDYREWKYLKENLCFGINVRVIGTLKKATVSTIPNGFNYKNYLERKGIYYLVDASNMKIISKKTNLFYYLKNKIYKRINKIDETGYLKAFILGNKEDMDEYTSNYYQENGISHLFSISGMHISFLSGMMLFLLGKITYNVRLKYFVIISFLVFYLFLTGASAAIIRTTILFILLAINKCYNLKIRRIDIMCLLFIIIVIINPYLIYDIGFQFSYLISLAITVYGKKINNIQDKFLRSLYISYICFLISFPISIYYFYQVNFLSIIFNIFLIPFVSTLVYPVALITFIFPYFYKIFYCLIMIMEYINNTLITFDFFKMVFIRPNLYLVFIYYFIIFISLYNKKYLIIFIAILVIHKSYIYFDDNLNIIYLDVSQGDSIFIKLPNNKGNILIDTGGILEYEQEDWMKRRNKYSIATSKIIPYLKSVGVSKLDYLILTHGDADHMGEASKLIDRFKVDKVVFNKGEYNYLENNLIKKLDAKKISYYKTCKLLRIDNYKFYFLNNIIYDNENDNSNVIYFVYKKYKFMFMGDAGSVVEEDIINKYDLQDITFLKIGHHGSNTSSSSEFINAINPRVSIISVGANNRYGHPKDEVLDNLKDSKVYRTDKHGSININIGEKCLINTYGT